jgi:hypothetical protein
MFVEKTKHATTLVFHTRLRVATIDDHYGKAYAIIKIDKLPGGPGVTQVARHSARGHYLFFIGRPRIRRGAMCRADRGNVN